MTTFSETLERLRAKCTTAPNPSATFSTTLAALRSTKAKKGECGKGGGKKK